MRRHTQERERERRGEERKKGRKEGSEEYLQISKTMKIGHVERSRVRANENSKCSIQTRRMTRKKNNLEPNKETDRQTERKEGFLSKNILTSMCRPTTHTHTHTMRIIIIIIIVIFFFFFVRFQKIGTDQKFDQKVIECQKR